MVLVCPRLRVISEVSHDTRIPCSAWLPSYSGSSSSQLIHSLLVVALATTNSCFEAMKGQGQEFTVG